MIFVFTQWSAICNRMQRAKAKRRFSVFNGAEMVISDSEHVLNWLRPLIKFNAVDQLKCNYANLDMLECKTSFLHATNAIALHAARAVSSFYVILKSTQWISPRFCHCSAFFFASNVSFVARSFAFCDGRVIFLAIFSYFKIALHCHFHP